jgi:ATP-dependent Lon protease
MTHEELAKSIGLEPAASEANVTRNYLEWLTPFPPFALDHLLTHDNT